MPYTMRDYNGLRVFVAEDEVLLAMVLQDSLEDLNCVVAGPYGTVADALEAVREEHDLAILDVNLCGQKVYPVAEALVALGVPIMFCTGDGGDLPSRFQKYPLLAKPYSVEELQELIYSAIGTKV